MGLINNYANALPALTDKVIGTDLSNNDATVNFLVSDLLALYGSPIGTCHASFYSTQDLAFAPTSGYTQPVFNVAEYFNSNITVASSSNITVAQAGVYKIDASLNVYNTSGTPITTGFVFLFLGLNGAAIPWTTRTMAINLAANPSWNTIYGSWMLNLAVNDYVTLYFKTSSTSYANMSIRADTSVSGTNPPSQKPSATLQISKV